MATAIPAVETDQSKSEAVLPRPPISARAQLAETVTFLVIGAQKAGTTWICDVLRRHPDVFIPDWKELHFFEQEPNFEKGYSWYLDFFRGSESALARGEGTPNYFYNVCTPNEHRDWINREVPQRIKDHLPDARLILSLRDPVQRAISSYNHFVLRGNLSPHTRLRDCWDERGIRSAGRYDLQLAKWLEHYDLDQFEIVIYEDDIKPDERKLATANRLFRAIGVSAQADLPGLFERSNGRLDSALAHLNQVGFLRDNRYGRKIRDRINGAIPAPVQNLLKVKVDPQDVDALREEFEPHNRALEAMIGRKLPW
ncbi:MAG: sulfotransferase [Pseudomonadota bacterium]